MAEALHYRDAGPRSHTDAVASVWLRGAFAAASSAAIAGATLIVLALAVWAADARSGATAGATIRFALAVWLAAHRVPVGVPGASIVLAPLGLTLLLGLLLARAAAVVARGSRVTTLADVGTVVAAVTAPYTVLVTAAAVAARGTSLHPSPVGALFVGLLGGGIAAGVGAMHGCGLVRPTWRRLPVEARTPLAAAGGALAVLGALGALSLIVAIGVHQHAERSLVTRPGGVVGSAVLVLLCVALLPNALGFATGYVAGPGFAVGAGTSVTFAGSHLGAVPAVPLLAAVPHDGSPWWALGCAAGWITAGALAAWLIRRAEPDRLLRQLQHAAVAAAAAGIAVALLTGLSGGSIGPGRMAAVGPSPWQAGLAVAGEVALAAALILSVWSWIELARAALRPR